MVIGSSSGCRIVEDMTLTEQDAMAEEVKGAFDGAKEYDLRDHPRYGYRAVHVVVPREDCWVEVQVRTRMQDLWANVVESFESELGRGIRYGAKPLHPRKRVKGTNPNHPGLTQTQVVTFLKHVSELVEAVEIGKEAVARGDPGTDDPVARRELAEAEKEVKSLFERILRARRKGPS